MSNNSPRITLEGSFSHDQLKGIRAEYPEIPLPTTSPYGEVPPSALDTAYKDSEDRQLNPSWYELYPLRSGEIVPIVSRSLLQRGNNEIYSRESTVPARAWNAIEHDVNLTLKRSLSGRVKMADFVQTVPVMGKYGLEYQLDGTSHKLTEKDLRQSFLDSKGRTLQPEWYELYPETDTSGIVPIVTLPVLKEGSKELTGESRSSASIASRAWNSLEDGAKLAKRGLAAPALLDFLILEEGAGTKTSLPKLALRGIYAHELAELADRAVEFKVPNFTKRETSTRTFLANFANTLLVHQSS